MPRAKKRTTNVEFVKDLMNYSPAGALAQAVIMQAIEEYAQKIVANRAQIIEQWRTTMIDGGSWVRACEHIIEKIAERRREF